METAEQRAERNRRTAERMRQRRAKIAEERGVVRTESRVTTLSADRFEEIFQSVVAKNAALEEAVKNEPTTASERIVQNAQTQQQPVVIAQSPHNYSRAQYTIF